MDAMVKCMEKATFQKTAAEAILKVIRENGRNQERAAEANLILVCANVALTCSGHNKDNKPYQKAIVKIFQCLEKDCGANWKKLGGVATAVKQLVYLVKRCWDENSRSEKPDFIPGGLEAGRLLLHFANKSKANGTTVRSAFPSDFDWMSWLRSNFTDKSVGWVPAQGVGSTILGNDGSVWGVVVADGGHCWKLEGARIAKKETKGNKWYWKDEVASAQGVGSTILGNDGSVWGVVVADGGHCWKLEGGRIAKKETQGSKWYWKDEVADS